MRVLAIGDIVGRAGRQALTALLPDLRTLHEVDYVIANGENAAAGKGITPRIAQELFAAGVDVITGGNHTFAVKEIEAVIDHEPRLLRPANYPVAAPGHGMVTVGRLTVINLIGRTFMQPVDCPFRTVDTLLETVPAGTVVVVDMHAEATSEKVAMGWYLDGRVAAVVGTHTHVPTADARLLPRATAVVTDLGMTGAVDSIIGDDVAAVLRRFLTAMPTRLTPAEGRTVIGSVLIEIDEGSGRATDIRRLDPVYEPYAEHR